VKIFSGGEEIFTGGMIENPPVPASDPFSDPGESGSGEHHPAPIAGDAGRENPERGVKIFSGGEEIFRGGVKKSSPGGEENFTENITNNIKFNTSSSPPEEDAEEEAPVLLTKERLKKIFAGINPLLVFSAAFYPKAAEFLAAQGFSTGYLSWLCEFCLEKKPKSLAGFYFNLFFSEQAVELYRLAQKERAPPPPDPCPVCGEGHWSGEPCPCCGLKAYPTPDEIADHTIYWALSDTQKAEFNRDFEKLTASDLDIHQKMERLETLRQKYGFV
jgi:hypothetical protein